MTVTSARPAPSWTARLAWALLLLFAGAGFAAWGLARWDAGARFLGIAPTPPHTAARPLVSAPAVATPVAAVDSQRLALLESRLTMLERETQSVQGSAGRADALVIAFAARRAVERGVALGYLEPLLVERFGAAHQRAVATIVTAAQAPVTQAQLIDDYKKLGPLLRGKAPDESWWTGMRRELGSLVAIRRNDMPSPRPAARYDRALSHLEAGEVESALAETMRLPGAGRPQAQGWIAAARRLIATRRALDEIESGALVGRVRATVGA
jgi:hypothetical protein